MSATKTRFLAVLAVLGASAMIPAAVTAQPGQPGFIQGGNSVNVYTSREPGLVLPLFYEFTFATGIAVNTIYVNQRVAERLATEGTASPADIVMLEDVGQLAELANRGLTQAVTSEIVNRAVPENLRDPNGHWFATSMRARVIYAAADRVTETAITYEDLAGPEWANRVCISSAQTPYNTGLFAAYIAKHGEAATEQYLRDLHANLAHRPIGGDRELARDILAGTCDVALGNTDFVNLMRTGVGGEEEATWGNAIRVIMPTFDDGLGTHVNISGVALAANAPHRDNAIRFIEFLVSEIGQQLYAEVNFEYPIRRPRVAAAIVTDELGPLVPDPTPLPEIAQHRDAAIRIVEAVGFYN